jgi:hypothetical protein
VGDATAGADVENMYYTAKCAFLVTILLVASCSHVLYVLLAIKEDDPEGALKALQAIVGAEVEKGDWYVGSLRKVNLTLIPSYEGVSKHSSNKLSCSFWSSGVLMRRSKRTLNS